MNYDHHLIGNFNPTPEIYQVEDSGNGSSGEDDLTNSPPEEIRNPSDDLGGSYIQQDNAELFIDNLGKGNKHAIKEYAQFSLNTNCFGGKDGDQWIKFHGMKKEKKYREIVNLK